MVRISAGRMREQRLRLLRRAACEHANAEFVEHGGMVRRLLRDPRQQLVGFGGLAVRRRRHGGLQHAVDGGVIEWGRGSSIH